MLAPALFGQGGPRGIVEGEIERLAIRCFVFLPLHDVARERELREWLAETRFELARDCCPVDPPGLVRLHLVHRLALDEIALHSEERIQLEMLCAERAELGFDTEEPASESVYVRRQLDDELGFDLACERLRV